MDILEFIEGEIDVESELLGVVAPRFDNQVDFISYFQRCEDDGALLNHAVVLHLFTVFHYLFLVVEENAVGLLLEGRGELLPE